MAPSAPLVHRFVIGVDVRKYSDLNTRRQQSVKADLAALLDEAAVTAGLDRSAWSLHSTGDGELAVLPPDADLARVVGRFVSALHTLLLVHNEDRAPGVRLRLRMAMHIDAIVDDRGDPTGPALVVVSRLLDSRPVRDALERAGRSDLALIVSDPVYDKVVLSGLGGIRAEQFHPVRVTIPAKGFDEAAYLHVPDHDMGTFGAGGDDTAASKPPDAGAPSAGSPAGPSPSSPSAPRERPGSSGRARSDRGIDVAGPVRGGVVGGNVHHGNVVHGDVHGDVVHGDKRIGR